MMLENSNKEILLKIRNEANYRENIEMWKNFEGMYKLK